MSPKLDRLVRGLQIAVVALGALALVLAAVWLVGERRWGAWQPLADQQAFTHGTLGLELAPIKYVLVIDKVSRKMVAPREDDTRPWPEIYGFLARPESAGKTPCEQNAPEVLPVGFTVSHLVPSSATPVPLKFAGLSCAACHSEELHTADGTKRGIVYGAGNSAADVIAFTDALKNATSDPSLTPDKILTAYEEQCGKPKGLWARTAGRVLDKALIGIWLAQFQGLNDDDASKYDLPYSGAELKSADDIPAGPSRTRPFRSVVRVVLDLPGARNLAFSKVPVVFEQNAAMRPWSQFDGSIGDHVTRSLIAARTSGSSVEALSKPEIEHNVRAAADYTLNLGSGPEVKTYAQLFPEAQYRIDPVRAERGFAVYQASCNACHGYRPLGGGGWSLAGADKIHQISSLAAIGTDPYRIEFRYSAMLPLAINAQFPGPPAVRSGDLPARSQQDARLDEAQQAALAARRGSEAAWWKAYHAQFAHAARLYPAGHPFAFPFAKVRQTPGFINNPIPFAYLRAPYLHNASVSTLAQLINLEPRAPVFCRGNNAYDPLSVGLVAPAPPADAPCPPLLPFRFDAGAPGNSNAGHDFPWAWNDPARDPERLRDLLEYLKTL